MAFDLNELMSRLQAGTQGASTSPQLEAMRKARLAHAEQSRQQLAQLVAMARAGGGASSGGGGGSPARAGSGGGNYSTPTSNRAGSGGMVTISTPGGGHVTVARNYAAKFSGLMTDLWNAGYHFKSVGGYNYRNIAGTNKLSKHALGQAIDIDPTPNRGTRLGGGGNPYGYFNPQTAVAIARKWGLDWGGTWKGQEDPMHFSTGG